MWNDDPTRKTHDHGTGFRIPLDKFELAFAERAEVVAQH